MKLTLLLLTATLAGLAFIRVIRHRYLVVTVSGVSMTPTLHDGDRALVRRTRLVDISNGQLVVAGPPTDERWAGMHLPELLIKRAVAVPGDVVPRTGAPALRDLPEDRVPAGRIVLVGDNPGQSLDSRFCGYFRDEQIVGVVVRQLPADHAAS